jgi:drug/metabolite transporter (DMT)-like permease
MDTLLKENNKTRYAVPLVAAAACWGLGTVMTKGLLAHIPPLTLLVTQLAASLIFLWTAVIIRRTPLILNRELRWLALAGWLNPGLAYTFGLLGLALTTASLSAIIWAAEPILILALAWLILCERPARLFISLSLVAAVGAILVVGSSGFAGGGSLTGNLLILAAVSCCAVYTVLSRRLVDRVDPILLTAVQQTVSLLWALFIWLAANTISPAEMAAPVPAVTWLWAALSGIVYYGLAFWFDIAGLKQTSATQAGFFINLIPIFGLAGAYLFLSERLAPLQWFGALLILLALFVLSRFHLPVSSEMPANNKQPIQTS